MPSPRDDRHAAATAFVLLLVLGLLAASVVVIATKPTKLGLDLQGGVELVYQGKPTRSSRRSPRRRSTARRDHPRARRQARRLRAGDPALRPRPDRRRPARRRRTPSRGQQQVGKVAQLYFYDWERTSSGRDGKPRSGPERRTVTGGQRRRDAGDPALRGGQARRRRPTASNNADRRVAVLLVNKTRPRRSIRGPEEHEADLDRRASERPRRTPRSSRSSAGTSSSGRPPRRRTPTAPTPDRPLLRPRDNPALTGTRDQEPRAGLLPGSAAQRRVRFTDRRPGQCARTHARDRAARRRPARPGAAPKNQHFAIVLDNELISAPYIDSTRTRRHRRRQRRADPRRLHDPVGAGPREPAETGALPIRLELITQSQVSATLGKQALDQGLLAGAIGFLVVMLFLIVFYRVLGVIAVAALGDLRDLLLRADQAHPDRAHAAGHRGPDPDDRGRGRREHRHLRANKGRGARGPSVPAAIAAGYKKGLTTIVDANVVTLMTAFILFMLATAGVKGFALTLGVGVIVSLFTAVLATQAILCTLRGTRVLQVRAALGARDSKRDRGSTSSGKSKWFFSMSGVILLICALAHRCKGLNFGIDFESGTRMTRRSRRPPTEDQVRERARRPGPRRREDPDAQQRGSRRERRADQRRTSSAPTRSTASSARSTRSSAGRQHRARSRSARPSARRWPTARSSRSSPR